MCWASSTWTKRARPGLNGNSTARFAARVKIVVMADARQRWFDGGKAKREAGASVVLSLDEKIQYIAERELSAAIVKTHAMAGTVVVMNPNTGEVLAMANWPKFNPNAAADVSGQTWMNRAVSVAYEPGSTFKLITL